MNRIILAGIAAVGITTAAHSQGIEGGQVRLGYARDTTNDSNLTSLGGSALYGLGGPLAIQGDLARHWEKGANNNTTVTGHLVYRLSETASVGGFLTWDHVPGTRVGRGIGIEGTVRMDTSTPVELEGYLIRSSANGTAADYTGLGAKASVNVTPQSQLRAGFFTASDGLQFDRYSVGLGYEFGNGLGMDMDLARIHKPSNSENVVSLGLSYKFGAGSTFGGRGLMDTLQGY